MNPYSESKQKVWNQIVNELNKIADKTGMPIDKGILETVAAFNALSIPTSASCEGHLEWGDAAPWVDIESETSEVSKRLKSEMIQEWDVAKTLDKESGSTSQIEQTLKRYHELKSEIKRPILVLTQKVLSLLDDFYKDRVVFVDLRLVVRDLGLDVVRIESQGAIVQEIRGIEERKRMLEAYQEEMTSFTNFLKSKFFE